MRNKINKSITMKLVYIKILIIKRDMIQEAIVKEDIKKHMIKKKKIIMIKINTGKADILEVEVDHIVEIGIEKEDTIVEKKNGIQKIKIKKTETTITVNMRNTIKGIECYYILN